MAKELSFRFPNLSLYYYIPLPFFLAYNKQATISKHAPNLLCKYLKQHVSVLATIWCILFYNMWPNQNSMMAAQGRGHQVGRCTYCQWEVKSFRVDLLHLMCRSHSQSVLCQGFVMTLCL